MASESSRPPPHLGLSARLLALTIMFVLIGEVLIFVPSIARFRAVYLEERIAAAHLATLALEAAPEDRVSVELEDELVRHAGILSVTLRRPQVELTLGELPPVDAVYDLREAGVARLILDSFATLYHQGQRTIRVVGTSPQETATIVDISLPEGPLWVEMVEYSWRILYLSIVLSVIVAALVYLSLQLMIVRPLARITERVVGFGARPEDPGQILAETGRRDEIGLVQRELRRMQEALRTALAQKARLAALGSAVGKINHDLRNLLSTAMLLSDRLERSRDPEVRRVAPRLVEALQRAARLCSETLSFARSPALAPSRRPFPLTALVDEVGEALLQADSPVRWHNRVPADLVLEADRDQLYRALMNLGRNAVDALAETGGTVSVGALRADGRVVIEVEDDGPGIPEAARAHLFEAFSGSARPGGTGLGLPIAREILRAHGGDLILARTGADGTVFRLELPDSELDQRRAA